MPNDRPLGEGLADQNLTPTAPSAWKKATDVTAPEAEAEGFIAELPSGNVVKMTRTLDMPILLKTGRIPNPLAGIVQKMMDTRSAQFPQEASDPAVLMQLLDLLNETAVRAIISPPFDAPAKREKGETAEAYQERLEGWQPSFTDVGQKQHLASIKEDEDHGNGPCFCERKVSVWDMTMDDRFFVFAVAQGAAADLASFREQQSSLVAGLQAGSGVRKPTKRTGGARPKKKK